MQLLRLHAFTHLWWFLGGPERGPYATEPDALGSWRDAIATVADVVVPGHGALFPLPAS